MRKGRDGEEKKLEKLKIMLKIVATTSLPVDRLTATDCNAAARANSFGAIKCILTYVVEECWTFFQAF